MWNKEQGYYHSSTNNLDQIGKRVIEHLMVLHIYCKEHDYDPDKAINDLINYYVESEKEYNITMTNAEHNTLEQIEDEFIVGYKGKTTMAPGFFYTPYNPFGPWYYKLWYRICFKVNNIIGKNYD